MRKTKRFAQSNGRGGYNTYTTQEALASSFGEMNSEVTRSQKARQLLCVVADALHSAGILTDMDLVSGVLSSFTPVREKTEQNPTPWGDLPRVGPPALSDHLPQKVDETKGCYVTIAHARAMYEMGRKARAEGTLAGPSLGTVDRELHMQGWMAEDWRLGLMRSSKVYRDDQVRHFGTAKAWGNSKDGKAFYARERDAREQHSDFTANPNSLNLDGPSTGLNLETKTAHVAEYGLVGRAIKTERERAAGVTVPLQTYYRALDETVIETPSANWSDAYGNIMQGEHLAQQQCKATMRFHTADPAERAFTELFGSGGSGKALLALDKAGLKVIDWRPLPKKVE